MLYKELMGCFRLKNYGAQPVAVSWQALCNRVVCVLERPDAPGLHPEDVCVGRGGSVIVGIADDQLRLAPVETHPMPSRPLFENSRYNTIVLLSYLIFGENYELRVVSLYSKFRPVENLATKIKLRSSSCS